jgi:hypothetical protein
MIICRPLFKVGRGTELQEAFPLGLQRSRKKAEQNVLDELLRENEFSLLGV